MEPEDTVAKAVGFIALTLTVAFWAGVIFVAVHFLSKVW
jgi:hypothetical protein